jgi:hypothetical protein
MKNRRERALLAGWLGTILLISFYVAIGRITALSFLLWVALMGGSCVLCFYGAVYRTKWFFVPAVCAIIAVVGAALAASG